MATKYNTNFNETYPMSDTGVKVYLATGVELTWTVPGDENQRYKAMFEYTYDGNVWVALNGTATAPGAGTATDTYNQQFRPKSLYVKGGDILHFIANVGTPQFGVSLLQLPN